MRLLRPLITDSRTCATLFFAIGRVHRGADFARRALAVGVLPAMFLARTGHEEIYNVLWTLVFGFATLNILSLGARHFEPGKSGLSFGETLAILVVLVSIGLLGWEMLYVFHILPIRLHPQ